MEGVTNICAWCGKRVPEQHEVFALGARAHPGLISKEQEGMVISLSLAFSERTVPAVVVTSTSEAKREGYDLVFVACSRKCGNSLKGVLQREVEPFSNVGPVD